MMIDFSEAFRKMVETRFQTEWGLEYPGVPIEFENMQFKQPGNKEFVKFTILQNPARPITIGRNKVIRTTGFLQIDVLVPDETGAVTARKRGEFAANTFFMQMIKGEFINARFDEKHVTSGPTEKEFFRIMARVFFEYDGFMETPAVL